MAFSSALRSSRSGGFTILELAAVLVLVTLVSTLAIRAWFGRSDVTLQNAAELLASDLREVQAIATLRHAPHEMVFHEDGSGYFAHELGQPQESAHERHYSYDAVFEDVRVTQVRVAKGGRLVFDALGRPASDALITVSHRGVARTVLIDAALARVRVEGTPRD